MIYITEVRMGRNGTKHEHIEAVRWERQDNPETGESTREEMIDWIGDKKDFAHVRDDKTHDVPVHVIRPKKGRLKGRPYLRTVVGEKVETDNLLALPRYGVIPSH